MIDGKRLLAYFEKFGLTPRPEQVTILEACAKNINNRFILINAPTGVGKSHIAAAVLSAVKSGYLITATKALQTQYVSEMSWMANLFGRNAYQCNIDPAFTVDAAPCISDKKLKRDCINSKHCAYFNAKDDAINAKTVLTNYQYYMLGVTGEDDPAKLGRREVLVIDEAHTLPDALANMASIELDTQRLHRTYGWFDDLPIEWDTTLRNNFPVLVKLTAKVAVTLEELEDRLECIMQTLGQSDKKMVQDEVKKLQSQIIFCEKLLMTLNILGDNPQQELWALKVDPEMPHILTIQPIYSDDLFEIFIGHKVDQVVMMSATMDKTTMINELGLDPNDVFYIEVDSPFPVENSPVYVTPVCKMNYNELQRKENLDAILQRVVDIAAAHDNVKGIIHTGNYRLATYIYENAPEELSSRLICRDRYFNGKKHVTNQYLLDVHEQSNEPTLLLSPSMHTGIDLRDDLSRIQVILKMPFASLADARVSIKQKLDEDWYAMQMFMTIMQSVGRSVRSMDDYADTYILDGSFKFYFQKYRHMLPVYFTRRVFFV